MVGEPLYDCFMPTAQGVFNSYNDISPPFEEDGEKDSNDAEDYGDDQCVGSDNNTEKKNDKLTAYQKAAVTPYQQAAVTPFDSEGAAADASLEMVSQPLPNNTSNVSMHNTVATLMYISVLFSALYRSTVI